MNVISVMIILFFIFDPAYFLNFSTLVTVTLPFFYYLTKRFSAEGSNLFSVRRKESENMLVNPI